MRKVILLVISGLAASVRGTGSFDVRTDGDKPALVLTTTLAYQLELQLCCRNTTIHMWQLRC
jgi:hypothetical protein